MLRIESRCGHKIVGGAHKILGRAGGSSGSYDCAYEPYTYRGAAGDPTSLPRHTGAHPMFHICLAPMTVL